MLKVKIDTKEKFNVITLQEPFLSANMTEEINNMLLSFLNKENKNVILKFKEVEKIDEQFIKDIIDIQQAFNNSHASFVICELQKPVKEHLDKLALSDIINITPTESEAWDIVQMEEIEREFT